MLHVRSVLKHVQLFEARPGAYPGDHLPEALEEGLDLRADGCGHAVLCHQVHILALVLVRHLPPQRSAVITSSSRNFTTPMMSESREAASLLPIPSLSGNI